MRDRGQRPSTLTGVSVSDPGRGGDGDLKGQLDLDLKLHFDLTGDLFSRGAGRELKGRKGQPDVDEVKRVDVVLGVIPGSRARSNVQLCGGEVTLEGLRERREEEVSFEILSASLFLVFKLEFLVDVAVLVPLSSKIVSPACLFICNWNRVADQDVSHFRCAPRYFPLHTKRRTLSRRNKVSPKYEKAPASLFGR